MVTPDENQILTQTSLGTPGGHVLRQYWQPAALTEELVGDRPLIPVTLMDEELVLFRDDDGKMGLIARFCSHRGVDLSFGRLEDGGLRCPFHGWLFDVTGSCIETPAEPANSTLNQRVEHIGYPVVERNGIIWAYLGDGSPPPLPDFDCLVAPPTHVFAFKGMWRSNWLQSHEVGVDPAHASFLHRFFSDDPETYGQQFRDYVADTGVTTTEMMREASAPAIEAEPTPFGFRLRTVRRFRDRFNHVRVSNCIFPNAITIAMSREMTITQWHVPITETTSYWYAMFVSFGDPVDADQMRSQRIDQVTLPLYEPIAGRHNQWGYDPDEQRSATYTGMGTDINVHDQWAVESQGPLFDRTNEHLTPTDVGIRTHRRLFLEAAKAPGPETMIGRTQQLAGPAAIDAVTTGDDYETAWQDLDRSRREASSWAEPIEYS